MREDHLLLNLKCKDLNNCIGVFSKEIKKERRARSRSSF